MHGVARLADLDRVSGWSEAVTEAIAPNPAERKLLIEHFTRWSLAEHASVASFARFTLQLLALGAPSDLVARAIRASADEVRHARFGFGFIELLSGEAAGPTELPVHDALGDVTLAETLRLAVREGMIGETIAALEAHVSADMTTLPTLREGLATIANEESEHAELAYAFGVWALRKQPDLVGVILEELARWQSPAMPERAGLEVWGILDADRRSAVHASGFTNVVRPLIEQLVAFSPSHLSSLS